MEDGGDDDETSFHDNEVIPAVQDEEQFFAEEEDYDDLYSDVNVGEGFCPSSVHGDDASASAHAGEEESERDRSPLPLPSLPEGDSPKKAQFPINAGKADEDTAIDRSGAFPVSDIVSSAGSAVPERSTASHGVGLQIEGMQADGAIKNDGFSKQGNGYGNGGFHGEGAVVGGSGSGNTPLSVASTGNADGASIGGGCGAILYVGDLHWWTTDADLEAELCKYGSVKEVKFFDEKASGKSKGYAQVEFCNPAFAIACKESMDGHAFNGKACVVTLASAHGVRRGSGEGLAIRNQQAVPQVHSQPAFAPKSKGAAGGIHIGGNYGRGSSNWGRGGIGNRGSLGNMRNRVGPPGGRGIMGNGGMAFLPPPPHIIHPGSLLGQGFDPTGYGGAMGRIGAGYGGFPVGPAPGPFPGLLPSFQPVVAPHVNPAFFGRVPAGVMGMWPSDQSMGGWAGEEQSGYVDDVASDQQYSDRNYGKDKAGDRDWSGASERRQVREKDAGQGQEWSERRHNEERDVGRTRDQDWDKARERQRERGRDLEEDRERERNHDDRDKHADQFRRRDHELLHDEDWDRGRSSKGWSNSKEVESAKRRRLSE